MDRCGPHFRADDQVAFLCQELFPQLSGWLCLRFFCEKHGKGEIDAMFAEMENWVKAVLKAPGPGQVISTPQQLVEFCTKGAAAINKRRSQGTEYQVKQFELAEKPPRVWKMKDHQIAITKTYALDIHTPGPNSDRRNPRIRDVLFADRTEGCSHLSNRENGTEKHQAAGRN